MSDQTQPLEFRPLNLAQPAPATMKIASDDTDLGYVIINVSDFDAATMTRYVEPAAEETAAPSKRTRAADKAE